MKETTQPRFTSSPCPSTQSKPKQKSKKERYAERKQIINEGKSNSDPDVIAAANRLEADNKAVERANLSDHVYSSHLKPAPPAPEGWKQLNNEELKKLGIDSKDLVDSKTGFKAAIYQSDFEQPPKTVIAFAGTEGEWADVKADLTQGVGMETEQYNQASLLTSKIATSLGPGNIETTGHSLGGGLAAMGSAKTGCQSTTLNAAGLHPKTAERLEVDRETLAERSKNIEAYHSSNDPLSAMQDNSGLLKGAIVGAMSALPSVYGVVGSSVAAVALSGNIPSALGNRHEVPAAPQNQLSWKDKILHPIDSLLIGHGSSKVVENIEHQKKGDVNKILANRTLTLIYF